MNRKYYSIDFAKFAFTLMVAVFHFWIHYGENERGGFIGVEFFFIVSGFLLMKQHEAHGDEIAPLEYVWKRIKKYYPHYFFSFLIIFLYRNVVVEYAGSFFELIRKFLKQAPEIFMLHGTIIIDEKTLFYDGMTWYLSALLIVSYVLWAALKKHKSALLTAAPVIVLWIYAYMAYVLKTTYAWQEHVFEIFNYATLRAVAGMLLGVLVYCARGYLVSSKTKMKGRRYLLYGTTIITFAFAASYKWFHRASFFYIACFAVGTIFITAGEELSGQAPPKPVACVIKWMSGISYAIYLNHYLVFMVLKRYFIPDYHHWVIFVYLIVLILYSMITAKLVKEIEGRSRRKRQTV